jgi:hypothetical protein
MTNGQLTMIDHYRRLSVERLFALTTGDCSLFIDNWSLRGGEAGEEGEVFE